MPIEHFDIIVVGSGSAGVSASLALSNRSVAMFDVGNVAEKPIFPDENLFSLKQAQKDLHRELLGDDFDALHNIFYEYLNVKLKSPAFDFITKNSKDLLPRLETKFNSTISFARGGLANAWGGAAIRFTREELRDFPIDYSELTECYDIISKHIGISGVNDDDLKDFLMEEPSLLPPLQMPPVAQKMLDRYRVYRNKNKSSPFFMGRQRHAIITEKRDGRDPYQYNLNDFVRYPISGLYTPNFTLEMLNKRDNFQYLNCRKVTHFEHFEEKVHVHYIDLKTNQRSFVECRKLVLAMGCLASTACVLRSIGNKKLNLLENSISYIPLLDFSHLGKASRRFGLSSSWLSLVYHNPEFSDPLYASLYDFTGPLRSDLILNLPLYFRGCLSAAKRLLDAMVVCQVFYPGNRKHLENTVSLSCDDQETLQIDFAHSNNKPQAEAQFLRFFRKLGYFSHMSLVKFPENGNSFHYAGTLPMKHIPKDYETYPSGQLHSFRNIYIADASSFSSLPAKNFTLTIMANAYRIARAINDAGEQ